MLFSVYVCVCVCISKYHLYTEAQRWCKEVLWASLGAPLWTPMCATWAKGQAWGSKETARPHPNNCDSVVIGLMGCCTKQITYLCTQRAKYQNYSTSEIIVNILEVLFLSVVKMNLNIEWYQNNLKSLTSDIWTFINKNAYFAVACNFIDDKKFNTVLLGVGKFPHIHTAENVVL